MKTDGYQQVKMDKKRHAQVKIFAVINGRKLYEGWILPVGNIWKVRIIRR